MSVFLVALPCADLFQNIVYGKNAPPQLHASGAAVLELRALFTILDWADVRGTLVDTHELVRPLSSGTFKCR